VKPDAKGFWQKVNGTWQGTNGGNYVGKGAMTPLPYLESEGEVIEGKVMEDEESFHFANKVSYQGHQILHIAIRNLLDGSALAPEGFVELMVEIDSFARKARMRITGMAFHCNGGLGRAPMVLAARALWNVAKMAEKAGMECTFEPDRQDEWVPDGNRVNMAAVLKRTLIRGCVARSTFMQAPEQMKAMEALAKHLCIIDVGDVSDSE
jgi:hypothetical protein